VTDKIDLRKKLFRQQKKKKKVLPMKKDLAQHFKTCLILSQGI